MSQASNLRRSSTISSKRTTYADSQLYRGYVSVLTRSLHQKTTKSKETLIEMAMVCKETALHSFVNNLDDMNMWCSRISKNGKLFLNERSGTENAATKQIESLSWPEDLERHVMPVSATGVNDTQMQDDLDKMGGEQSDRQTTTSVMNVRWLFRNS
jgi:hypothetical protein